VQVIIGEGQLIHAIPHVHTARTSLPMASFFELKEWQRVGDASTVLLRCAVRIILHRLMVCLDQLFVQNFQIGAMLSAALVNEIRRHQGAPKIAETMASEFFCGLT
jgi:hypothetical protein